MIRIKKILYPTDFSKDAKQALNHAIFLAEQFDAELHMLHVVTLHNDDPYNVASHFETVEEIYERVAATADSEMSALLEPHRNEMLRVVQAHRKELHPVPAILEYAESNDIDLIVMGTRGRRGLARVFQGSVAEETVRLAKCPVLTLQGQTQADETPVEAFNQILVPIDFSKYARAALASAYELAQVYHASLQLVHVIENPLVPDFYVPLVGTVTADTLKELERVAYDSLELMISTYGASAGGDVPYSCHVVMGRSTTEIVEFAESQKSDMIVLSTHGLTGMKRAFFGSVAEQVIRSATCPVFTSKAFGRSLSTED